jgi:hypothetical protein
VPPVVVRADLAVKRPIATVLGEPVEARLGYGATFSSVPPVLSPELLQRRYVQRARPLLVMDASLSLRRSFLEIGLEAQNLLDAEYADTEYSFVSNWKTTPVPSELPARHFSAGAPLTLLANVTLYL